MTVEIKMHVMHVPGADPERDRNVEILKALVPNICVHEDAERKGAMWNWATVMNCMVDDPAPWQVQLNDDATLLKGWQLNLPLALAHSPRSMVGLAWVGTRRGAKAVEMNKAYAVGDYLPAGLAIGYHHSIVSRLAKFASIAALTAYKHDDAAACLWAKLAGFKPAVVGRSIFGTLNTKSLMGHAAYTTGIHTIETPGVPWSRGFVIDNHMGKRDDEREFLTMMMMQGWDPEWTR